MDAIEELGSEKLEKAAEKVRDEGRETFRAEGLK